MQRQFGRCSGLGCRDGFGDGEVGCLGVVVGLEPAAALEGNRRQLQQRHTLVDQQEAAAAAGVGLAAVVVGEPDLDPGEGRWEAAE